MCRQSATVCLIKPPSRRQRELPDVKVRLGAVPDPRGRRGRRHALASVLLTAACAVLAGTPFYLAIGPWARHAPQDSLARLGFHPRGPLGVRLPASASDCAPGAGRGVSRRPCRPPRTGAGRHGFGRGGRQECPRFTQPIPPRPPTCCPRSRPPAGPSAS
ncbi:MAG: transposase family protein [Actinomycetota bacterium]|nr:transposase family protein [Actinomycetota bacterium]